MKAIDFFWKLFELNDGSVTVHCNTEEELKDFFENAKKHGFDYYSVWNYLPVERFKEMVFVNRGITIRPFLDISPGFLSNFTWEYFKENGNDEISDPVALEYLRKRKGK